MPEQDYRREKDAPLRQDIRTLGNALGRAIQRHGGHYVFDTVEQLRRHCKRLRECTDQLSQTTTLEDRARLQSEITHLALEIGDIVTSCDPETATDVIRAFTIYFHLVNTAEQHHRIRRRRSHETSNSDQPQRGSLAALLAVFPAQ